MTTPKEKMLQARALIEAQDYAAARAILVTVDHPTARDWIAKIDALDPFAAAPQSKAANTGGPQKIEIKQKGGPGCFKIGLGMGCVAPAAFCIGLIIIGVIIATVVQAGKETATKDAIKRNGGFGTSDNPIAVSEWASFKEGRVRATRLIRQADVMVEEFNSFNPDPPAGADYVLVWFELECLADKCRPGSLDFRLMDQQKKDWGEPWLLVLDQDFEQEALRGATTSGWQGFQFPAGQDVQTIKIEWDSETLHIRPPAPE